MNFNYSDESVAPLTTRAKKPSKKPKEPKTKVEKPVSDVYKRLDETRSKRGSNTTYDYESDPDESIAPLTTHSKNPLKDAGAGSGLAELDRLRAENNELRRLSAMNNKLNNLITYSHRMKIKLQK